MIAIEPLRVLTHHCQKMWQCHIQKWHMLVEPYTKLKRNPLSFKYISSDVQNEVHHVNIYVMFLFHININICIQCICTYIHIYLMHMHMHIYSYVYISRWVTRTLPLYFEMKTWLCFASPADSAKRLKLNKVVGNWRRKRFASQADSARWLIKNFTLRKIIFKNLRRKQFASPVDSAKRLIRKLFTLTNNGNRIFHIFSGGEDCGSTHQPSFPV